MTPFLIALQFLTCLPVRLRSMPSPVDNGRSIVYYPLIGLIVGALLAGLASLLSDAPGLLAAALVLAAWVALTGALHLDGLADSADAWLGGFGDRERTLAIMKDPRSGPLAVAVLVLLLLLKFAALHALLANREVLGPLIAITVARASVVALLLWTPYARPGGLGHVLAMHMPRASAKVALMAVVVLIGAIAGAEAVGVALIAVVTFWLCRRAMLRRIGGTTGDTAGALIELTECTVLVWLALNL